MGDGWFPLFRPDDHGRELIASMREQARAAGRDPASIGVESWVSIRNSSEDDWRQLIDTWRELDATHISVNTMNAGIDSVDGHIEAIRRFKEVAEG
jgi:alkanesulfonate monooxygenase SsuD/methylene tetrahydromethanopterin reductase-like flavin-dependent oxidoreductase (luciferase family)